MDKSFLRNVAVFFLVLAAVAAFALLQGPPRSTPRRQQIEQPVAGSGAAVAPSDTARVRVGAASHGSTHPIDVFIELEAGEFEIVPAATGGAIHVDADYDEALHRLEHEFEADPPGGRFRLRFTTRGSWRHVRRAVNDATGRVRRDGEEGSRRARPVPSRVRVELPVGVPMNLELRVGKGSTRIDLTGISLRRLALDHGMGDTDLVIRQPNPLEMEALDVRAKMGDLTLSGLGHAHARRFDFAGQMGAFELDFDGAWQADLEGSVTITMGNAVIDIPAGVALELTGRKVIFGGLETSAARPSGVLEAERAGYTATLQTSVRLGNLDIR